MDQYLDTTDADWFKPRLMGVMVVISAAFVVLIVRLLYLQVIEGAEYQRLSAINSIRLQSVDAPRGLIYDRNGRLLVDNRPAFDLSIIPKDAKPVGQTLTMLSRHTRIPLVELEGQLAKYRGRASYKPVPLKSDIGRDLLAAVEVHRFELPGIRVDVRPRRNYLVERSATHALGYLGEISEDELASDVCEDCRGGDYVGKTGLERALEGHMRGKRGGRQVEVNAAGQVVRVLKTVDALPGKNIFLTIDAELQAVAEAQLVGKAGAVVAVDPTNGEILCMASSPTFDQNIFITGVSREAWQQLSSDPYRPFENKAVQAEYPPASTYKIITAIAGLEEGVIDENTTYDCPGHLRFGNRTFRCWRRAGHGTVDVNKALAESCDVFFYHVGTELGIDRLAWYAKACGLGSPTGVGLYPEGRGLVPTAAWKKKRVGVSWQRGETLSVAIGQGYNLTTPIQLAMLTAAVANGGDRLQPSLVKSIKTAEGHLVTQAQRKLVGHLPVNPTNLDLVKHGLWTVVNHTKGTAYKARIEGLEMCGKTGTAQVIGRKPGVNISEEDLAQHLKPHAWFVGYAPAIDPKIAVAVIVENGEHGSSAAAPVVSAVIRHYLLGPVPEVEEGAGVVAAVDAAGATERSN
ncbi:MAG: penicillin-binding protein 2 [Desulfosarcinaceae bacterium]|nr:penicillin-binding protein 2 [Desulfosarcinaceae bacterium]